MNDFSQPGASIPILQVSLSHWLSRVANYLCDVVDQALLIHLRVPSRSRRPLHVGGVSERPIGSIPQFQCPILGP